MKNYLYVDYENLSNINSLPKLKKAKFFIFVGNKQQCKIKYEQGISVKIIQCKVIGKNFLDCMLTHFLLKRINAKNVFHFIVSKDKGFDSWCNYINFGKDTQIVKRIENFNNLNL